MRDMDELLIQVLPLAPSCPEPLAIKYIREAAIELATRGKFWTERDSFTYTAEDYEEFTPFDDANVLVIDSARFNGMELTPIDPKALDELLGDWDHPDNEAGTPRYITQLKPGQLTLIPREPGTLRLRCVLVPSPTATTVPDFMIDLYAIEIGLGAIGSILMHPNGEWSNPQLGAVHREKFERVLLSADSKTLKGQQRAPVRTRPNFF